VDDVDLFTGAMCEPPLEGAVVGATLACLIGRQFADLKYGDRFFYQTSGQLEGFNKGNYGLITY
jgi:peroxidase